MVKSCSHKIGPESLPRFIIYRKNNVELHSSCSHKIGAESSKFFCFFFNDLQLWYNRVFTKMAQTVLRFLPITALFALGISRARLFFRWTRPKAHRPSELSSQVRPFSRYLTAAEAWFGCHAFCSCHGINDKRLEARHAWEPPNSGIDMMCTLLSCVAFCAYCNVFHTAVPIAVPVAFTCRHTLMYSGTRERRTPNEDNDS